MDAMSRIWCFLLICLACLVHHLEAVISWYCYRPLNRSDCGRPPTYVFTYYKPGSRCELELWRGCPTSNKFDTEAMCSHTCIAKMLFGPSKDKYNDRPPKAITTTTARSKTTTTKPSSVTTEKPDDGDDDDDFPVDDVDPDDDILKNRSLTWDNETGFIHDYDLVDYEDLGFKVFLKIYLKPKNWTEAWQTCRDDTVIVKKPDGEQYIDHTWLGIPLSRMMNIHIKYLVKRHVPCGVIHTSIHNSYTKVNHFHSFHSYLQNITYLKWRFREYSCPPASQDNVVVFRSDGKIDVATKADEYPFFCYYATNYSLSAPQCGNRDTDYIYTKGSCYKYHNETATWDNASSICNSEGGYLAVAEIHHSWFNKTVSETDFLFEIYLNKTRDPKLDSINTNDNSITAFIGHKAWKTAPDFWWYSIFGYMYASKTLPQCMDKDQTASNRLCGTILGNYTKENPTNRNYSAITGCQKCDTMLPFICEKEPAKSKARIFLNGTLVKF